MLQNRYGDREFPVRDRWSSARMYRELLRRQDPRRAARHSLIWVAPALIAFAGIGVLVVVDDGSRRADAVFLIGMVIAVLLVAGGLTAGMLVDRTKPRREQLRYRELTGTAEVTEHQQRLLALDAQSDYDIGAWNSSLDYGPAWSMLPADVQRSHEQRAQRPMFVTMPLFPVRDLRAKLDRDQHIASSSDLELFVADALSDASLSARFHRTLHAADGERMLARLASLTGVSQWDLRALDEPLAGQPAHLLWGADSQRLISIIRMAHLAGYLDAPAAWTLIERAAAPASGLFSTWDGYWANVRTGVAFFTDRLDVVQQFDESLAGLRSSAWPAASADFPSGPPPSWLPRYLGDSARAPDDPA